MYKYYICVHKNLRYLNPRSCYIYRCRGNILEEQTIINGDYNIGPAIDGDIECIKKLIKLTNCNHWHTLSGDIKHITAMADELGYSLSQLHIKEDILVYIN